MATMEREDASAILRIRQLEKVGSNHKRMHQLSSASVDQILSTRTEEAVTNLTLQEIESRLAGRGFFKAHRAYLVNLQHIKAVIQYTRNSYTLLLNDDHATAIPLSKQSEKELQALLGY